MTEHPAVAQVTAAAIGRVLGDPSRIDLTYQPVLDVYGHRTAGWEIRTHVTHGPDLPTDQWFEAAYRLGLGTRLEACVLGRLLPAWRHRVPGSFMTINVTPAALADEEIEQLLTEQGPLHGLVVELTELTELTDPTGRSWAAACRRLHEHGALIAIDDLGTGYAELAEILGLRPDIIKLDRSVVATVDHDPAQQALVRFVRDFSDNLDAWVVAQGVERPGQLAALHDLGVPLAQGWLLGRPAAEPRPCPAHLTRGSGDHPRRPGTVATLARSVALTLAGQGQGDRGVASVMLDDQGRPVSVRLPRDGAGPVAPTPAGLLVPPDLPLVETARRAMARPAAGRFDPLVCVDASGRVLGVVDVQDLVLALADARSAGRAGHPARQVGQQQPRRRR